jgi:hypothetical protein
VHAHCVGLCSTADEVNLEQQQQQQQQQQQKKKTLAEHSSCAGWPSGDRMQPGRMLHARDTFVIRHTKGAALRQRHAACLAAQQITSFDEHQSCRNLSKNILTALTATSTAAHYIDVYGQLPGSQSPCYQLKHFIIIIIIIISSSSSSSSSAPPWAPAVCASTLLPQRSR